MKLYFFRHGEAEDEGNGIDDHARKLTTNGVARVNTAARVLAKLGVKPAHIYSSPRVRARQTADILSRVLGVRVEEREEVNFDFNMEKLQKLIKPLKDDAEVILVGHEPTFSSTVRDLTGGTIEMKKGGCARVDVYLQPALRGTLIWLIAPKVFDLLGD